MKRNGRGPAKIKSLRDYSRKQKSRVTGQLKDECQTTLAFLGRYDFIATKVKLFNCGTNQYEMFELVPDGELKFKENESDELTDSDIDDVNMWMYLKDKFSIADEAWHEIAVKANGLPKLYSMKKRMSHLNSMWNLTPTPGDADGVQVEFSESLKKNVINLQQTGILQEGDIIKVKLNADGTNIGKRLTVVNFAYTILNEKPGYT